MILYMWNPQEQAPHGQTLCLIALRDVVVDLHRVMLGIDWSTETIVGLSDYGYNKVSIDIKLIAPFRVRITLFTKSHEPPSGCLVILVCCLGLWM